jgi:hypothetical protein
VTASELEKNAGKMPALPADACAVAIGGGAEKYWEHCETIWRFYRQFMWQ